MLGKRFLLFELPGFKVQIDANWLFLAMLVTWALAKSVFSAWREDLNPTTYWWMAVVGVIGLVFSLIFGGAAEKRGRLASTKIGFLMAAAGSIMSGVLAAISPGLALAESNLTGRANTAFVVSGETLLDIARRHDLGFVEIRAANPGMDPWIPAPGSRVVLPIVHLLPVVRHEGIVINLADQRLYFFPPQDRQVMSFPVGIGKIGWETPLGRTKVVDKRENPTWVPPPSIRTERPDLPPAFPPGPNNPLGAFALDLGWDRFVIHGTNRPEGVGRRVSHGCIRLYPEDIARLYPLVRVGTPVTFLDQEIKFGWFEDELYLEAHPSQAQADEIEADGRFTPAHVSDIAWRAVRAAGEQAARLDWPRIDQVIAERRGIPVRITR
jgi:L,D-transpeptidase ErfK/SrfK